MSGSLPQLVFDPSPLDRITKRTRKQLAINMALEQVVLRPLLNGATRQVFVFGARQHDNRDGRRVGSNLQKRL
ncbi:hypothetical protein D3C83_140610 [compost metagenome]